MAMISCTVVLASTNPSAVFDNGVLGLASPTPLQKLNDLQTAQAKEEREEEKWEVFPWKQKTYGDFFDQVAELENLTPVTEEDTFVDLHLEEGTSQALCEGLQDSLPPSPWSSSTSGEDKESSDDSVSFERDKYGAGGSKSKNNDCPKILDKRVRNNQASKKFRQLRKGRHKALFDLLQSLENENYELNVQMEQMNQEIQKLKAVLPKQDLSYTSLLE